MSVRRLSGIVESTAMHHMPSDHVLSLLILLGVSSLKNTLPRPDALSPKAHPDALSPQNLPDALSS